MATQKFLRNLSNLYQDGEKKMQHSFVSSGLLRERKKRLTLAVYFLCLETPGLPACYPLQACRKQYTRLLGKTAQV